MFLLGLVLLGATGAFVGLLIAYNSAGGPDYTVTMFNHTLGTLNSLEIFLAGIALTLVFCLALAMMFAGARHIRRRAADRRTALREARQARAERDALAARLDAEQQEREQVQENELERERERERERVYANDEPVRPESEPVSEAEPVTKTPHTTGAASWRP